MDKHDENNAHSIDEFAEEILDSHKIFSRTLDPSLREKSNSMLKIADKYYFGTKGEKDLTTALHWYLQAAKNGNIKAITQVGLMYYNGIGTTVDYEKAFFWFNTGFTVLHRNAPLLYTLAEMYFYGRGVEQNYSAALHFYSMAYGNGCNRNAAFRLAEMYEYGYGVEIDNKRALDYYTKAAESGNVVAMNKLGLIYETGELVEQDYDKAGYWYSLAAQQGSTFAAAKLEELPAIASEK